MSRGALTLAAAAALLAAYAMRVPPGDAPDEPAHLEYAASLARTGRLPVWRWPLQPLSYESFQPPLYYAGAAAVLRASGGLSPRGRFLLARLFSALLAAAALAFILRLGRDLDAGDGPLLAACAVPMFFFVGGTVNNDAAASLAGAALLWRAATAARGAPVRDGVLAGALVGAALLCKLTVLPEAAVLLAVSCVERRRPRPAALAAAAAAALLLCGWFYARNMSLYGDPFGLSRIGAYDRDRFAWSQLPRWLGLFFQSFWGRFGWMTKPMPGWAYWAAAAATAAAAAGWALDFPRLRRRPGRAVLAAAGLLALAQNVWYGFFASYQPQARYSFPAFAAWAVLSSDGWAALGSRLPPPARRAAAWGAAAGAAALHLAAWRSV